MINSVVLMGEVLRSPKRYTDRVQFILGFSRLKLVNGVKVTELSNITCYCEGAIAQVVEGFVVKGSKVVVSGYIENNDCPAIKAKIEIQNIEFIPTKRDTDENIASLLEELKQWCCYEILSLDKDEIMEKIKKIERGV